MGDHDHDDFGNALTSKGNGWMTLAELAEHQAREQAVKADDEQKADEERRGKGVQRQISGGMYGLENKLAALGEDRRTSLSTMMAAARKKAAQAQQQQQQATSALDSVEEADKSDVAQTDRRATVVRRTSAARPPTSAVQVDQTSPAEETAVTPARGEGNPVALPFRRRQSATQEAKMEETKTMEKMPSSGDMKNDSKIATLTEVTHQDDNETRRTSILQDDRRTSMTTQQYGTSGRRTSQSEEPRRQSLSAESPGRRTSLDLVTPNASQEAQPNTRRPSITQQKEITNEQGIDRITLVAQQGPERKTSFTQQNANSNVSDLQPLRGIAEQVERRPSHVPAEQPRRPSTQPERRLSVPIDQPAERRSSVRRMSETKQEVEVAAPGNNQMVLAVPEKFVEEEPQRRASTLQAEVQRKPSIVAEHIAPEEPQRRASVIQADSQGRESVIQVDTQRRSSVVVQEEVQRRPSIAIQEETLRRTSETQKSTFAEMPEESPRRGSVMQERLVVEEPQRRSSVIVQEEPQVQVSVFQKDVSHLNEESHRRASVTEVQAKRSSLVQFSQEDKDRQQDDDELDSRRDSFATALDMDDDSRRDSMAIAQDFGHLEDDNDPIEPRRASLITGAQQDSTQAVQGSSSAPGSDTSDKVRRSSFLRGLVSADVPLPPLSPSRRPSNASPPQEEGRRSSIFGIFKRRTSDASQSDQRRLSLVASAGGASQQEGEQGGSRRNSTNSSTTMDSTESPLMVYRKPALSQFATGARRQSLTKRPAESGLSPSPSPAVVLVENKVFVNDLTEEISDSELRNYFGQFGEVAELARIGNVAVVAFHSVEARDAALEFLQVDLGGRQIRVSLTPLAMTATSTPYIETKPDVIKTEDTVHQPKQEESSEADTPTSQRRASFIKSSAELEEIAARRVSILQTSSESSSPPLQEAVSLSQPAAQMTESEVFDMASVEAKKTSQTILKQIQSVSVKSAELASLEAELARIERERIAEEVHTREELDATLKEQEETERQIERLRNKRKALQLKAGDLDEALEQQHKLAKKAAQERELARMALEQAGKDKVELMAKYEEVQKQHPDKIKPVSKRDIAPEQAQARSRRLTFPIPGQSAAPAPPLVLRGLFQLKKDQNLDKIAGTNRVSTATRQVLFKVPDGSALRKPQGNSDQDSPRGGKAPEVVQRTVLDVRKASMMSELQGGAVTLKKAPEPDTRKMSVTADNGFDSPYNGKAPSTVMSRLAKSMNVRREVMGDSDDEDDWDADN